MSAIHNHFDRLAALLPPEQVAALLEAYRADAAADSRASRERMKARQVAQQALRAKRTEAPDG